MFANMYAAYESLSEPIRNMLDGLTAIHDSTKAHSDRKPGQGSDMLFPRAEHPVVRVHPMTRRKLLFVDRGFTTRIPQLRKPESDALLAFLFDAYRNSDAFVPFQMAEEFDRILGQSQYPASGAVRLLPAQTLRPSGHDLRRQAVRPGLTPRGDFRLWHFETFRWAPGSPFIREGPEVLRPKPRWLDWTLFGRGADEHRRSDIFVLPKVHSPHSDPALIFRRGVVHANPTIAGRAS